ncbi:MULTISPECIES: DUF2637 domain-containing protein [unclassified Streptomyces]|uniref:DUF2637 domain-containing protein n=1 Tax=unclassified Streptomyces TaxID=2593676 RepID=UPI002E28A06B|nr:DUF2637 domain-containing protein [Streptomyces sp. NBC_00223]
MTLAHAPGTAHVTGWDRTVVIALGGAGCALSYDALQQMAVAIHVRGPLTYLFPLVIDGFIAYGIRALLVLRDAPLRSRLYVWMLFGTATAASIWANALHAVRLNQQAPVTDGLRLSDTVVAVLSTIAPLALAGAVHLYILIARGPDNHGDRPDRHDHSGQPGHGGQPGQGDRASGITVTAADRTGQRSPHAGQTGAGQPVTAPTGPHRVTGNPPTSVTGSLTGNGDRADNIGPVTGHRDHHGPGKQAADLGGQPDNGPAVTTRPVGHPAVADRPVAPAPVSDREPRRAGDRRPDLDTEELLEIARSAVRAEDKLTRKVVAQAIRGQQIPLSSDTLTALMAQLREQHAPPVTTSQD